MGQCIFVRGFRVARTSKILPWPRARGLAGLNSDPERYSAELDVEPSVGRIPVVPALHKVSVAVLFWSCILAEPLKYREPLHMLLGCIAEVSTLDREFYFCFAR